MKVKISLDERGATVRIKGRGGGAVVTIGVGRRTVAVGRGGRGDVGVTAAMRAAGVTAFLDRGDREQLGRSLAEVYRVMDRAKLAGPGDVDDAD